MSQFLFVVEVPTPSTGLGGITASHAWTKFSNEASTILKPLKTCRPLQSNVWLLPVENGLPVLLALSSMAEECNLAYSALLIEGVTDLSAKKSGAMQRVPINGI